MFKKFIYTSLTLLSILSISSVTEAKSQKKSCNDKCQFQKDLTELTEFHIDGIDIPRRVQIYSRMLSFAVSKKVIVYYSNVEGGMTYMRGLKIEKGNCDDYRLLVDQIKTIAQYIHEEKNVNNLLFDFGNLEGSAESRVIHCSTNGY